MPDFSFLEGDAIKDPKVSVPSGGGAAPAPRSDPMWDSVVKQASGLQEQGREISGELKKSRERSLGILDRMDANKPPAPPEIEKPEKPNLTAPNTDPVQSFGSFASALGIFGAMLTKRPLTAALNASSGAMNAFKQRDLEKFEQQREVWKANSEYASKLAKWQTDKYTAALEQYKGENDKALSAIRIISAADQDLVMSHATETGDLNVVLKALQDRQMMVQNYSQQQLQLAQFVEQARHNLVLEKGTTPQAQAFAKFREENPGATAEQESAFLQRWHQPRSAPAMALQKYVEENPEATSDDLVRFAADYQSQITAERAFATGTQGKQITAFNTAIDHLETAEELAKALQNGDMVGMNRAAQYFAAQTGSAAPTNFDTAKQIISNEVVKAIVNTGGGVKDRTDAQAVFDRANSPEQLAGAIETTRKLLAGQLRSLDLQYQQTTKKDNFSDRLTPGARSAYERLNTEKKGSGKTKYSIGQEITTASGKYRIVGNADSDDPDVEPVK